MEEQEVITPDANAASSENQEFNNQEIVDNENDAGGQVETTEPQEPKPKIDKVPKRIAQLLWQRREESRKAEMYAAQLERERQARIELEMMIQNQSGVSTDNSFAGFEDFDPNFEQTQFNRAPYVPPIDVRAEIRAELLAEQQRQNLTAKVQSLNEKVTNPDTKEFMESEYVGWTPESARAVIESNEAVELLDYLASDQVEAERILSLPNEQMLREIGRLEGRLAANKAQQKPIISSAPRPVPTLAGSGAHNPTYSFEEAEKAYLRGEI